MAQRQAGRTRRGARHGRRALFDTTGMSCRKVPARLRTRSEAGGASIAGCPLLLVTFLWASKEKTRPLGRKLSLLAVPVVARAVAATQEPSMSKAKASAPGATRPSAAALRAPGTSTATAKARHNTAQAMGPPLEEQQQPPLTPHRLTRPPNGGKVASRLRPAIPAMTAPAERHLLGRQRFRRGQP